MYRSVTSILTFVLAVSVWQSSDAAAQVGGFQQPYSRPTFSPYLNLFRGGRGAGPILNYYGLVRPQQEFYQQSEQFHRLQTGTYEGPSSAPVYQQQPRTVQQSSGMYTIGVTGHGVTYMSIGRPRSASGAGTTSNLGLYGSQQQSGGRQSEAGYQYGSAYSGHSAGYGYSGLNTNR